MRTAIAQARQAANVGEVPIGAALVLEGELLAQAHNAPVSTNNACAHAEIRVIEAACKAVGNYRLGSLATLYVTLQPCLMCLGAIMHARIGRVVIGCAQSRFNGDLSKTLEIFEHGDAWHPCRFETGCMAEPCEQILSEFFKTRRTQRLQAIEALANLMHLPNVNKGTLQELEALGIRAPADLLTHGLEPLIHLLEQRSAELKRQQSAAKEPVHHSTQHAAQQAAILASLCDYFRGEPVRSWKLYLDQST